MLDAQIQAIIQSTLIAGLVARGLNPSAPTAPLNIGVMQNYQPRPFVAPSIPMLFHTLGPRKKYGWPSAHDVVNPDQSITTTTTQIVHTRFQLAGCVPNVSPANPNGYTSGDLASIAADIMQHETAIAAFVAAGCNVFRVMDTSTIPFQDMTAQNIWWSSFDIIFTHKDVFTTSTGVVSTFNQGIYRV